MADVYNIIVGIVLPLISALIILFNSLELFLITKVYWQRRTKQKNNVATRHSYIYLASLCVSNILAGGVILILKFLVLAMAGNFQQNKIALESYKILRFIFIKLSLFSSICNLSALSWDRYLATTHPLRYLNLKKEHIYKILAAIWIFCSLLTIVVYSVLQYGFHNGMAYNYLTYPVVAFPATIIFVGCYLSIYKVIVRRRNDVTISSSSSTKQTTKKCSETDDNTDENLQKNNNMDSRKKREGRLLKLVLVTVLSFCVCWIPFSTCGLVRFASPTCGNELFHLFTFVLAFSNSLFSPFFYVSHYRKQLKAMFRKQRKIDEVSEIRNEHSTRNNHLIQRRSSCVTSV